MDIKCEVCQEVVARVEGGQPGCDKGYRCSKPECQPEPED